MVGTQLSSELAQISFYLAKEGVTFDTAVKKENILPESEVFKIREFEVDRNKIKFFCLHSKNKNVTNPPWLTFINQQLEDEEQISFSTFSERPSGLLLLEIKDRILAACFGVKGGSLLNKVNFLPDFGIKTAMNMCGNEELRQTKSSVHATTTQNIDRQTSKPSDAFSFGLNETEFLQYISAHLEKNRNVTLQGKDNLTLKTTGQDKLSWEKLIEYGYTFISEFENDKYKELFPNYPNLQNVSDEKAKELDEQLIEKIKNKDFLNMHLAIPEFISDDKYSFSYTNYSKRENNIYPHILIDHLESGKIVKLNKISIDVLKNKNIFAYSHEEDKILGYRKWDLYSCFVAEIETAQECFVLANGMWKKVDDDFYTSVNDFIKNVLPEETIDEEYHDFDIFDTKRMQNREEIFNNKYCDENSNTVKFDQAKLQIGLGKKDKEFCDILEYKNNLAHIIHVKKFGGSSSINYLFSQARFYCEFFLSDDVFLKEIRSHIDSSSSAIKDTFLDHIKKSQAQVNGKDFAVGLWILYDNKEEKPEKMNLPLMAKYELKLTYERLRNVYKYSSVVLSMIPVKMAESTKRK